MSETVGDVIVVGGGCYGTFYAGQLASAKARGRIHYRQVLVVDRDPACQVTRELPPAPDRRLVRSEWGEFFDEYLAVAAGAPPDAPRALIVPSPLMPHLMFEWLLRRARARWPGRRVDLKPLGTGPGTPYDVSAPDGTRYTSFADWTCPTHCTEPALCPVIGAPRTWEMSEALADWTRELHRQSPTLGPLIFHCRHVVFGVGAFEVAAALDNDRRVANHGAEGGELDLLVGTVSSCHGAVNLLHLGPWLPREAAVA